MHNEILIALGAAAVGLIVFTPIILLAISAKKKKAARQASQHGVPEASSPLD